MPHHDRHDRHIELCGYMWTKSLEGLTQRREQSLQLARHVLGKLIDPDCENLVIDYFHLSGVDTGPKGIICTMPTFDVSIDLEPTESENQRGFFRSQNLSLSLQLRSELGSNYEYSSVIKDLKECPINFEPSKVATLQHLLIGARNRQEDRNPGWLARFPLIRDNILPRPFFVHHTFGFDGDSSYFLTLHTADPATVDAIIADLQCLESFCKELILFMSRQSFSNRIFTIDFIAKTKTICDSLVDNVTFPMLTDYYRRFKRGFRASY
jgi:hypothetical protein